MELNEQEEVEGTYLLVDSIADDYEGFSKRPAMQGSSADSPFIGKSPRECEALLQELNSNSRLQIETDFFIILDERSGQDESALLVVVMDTDILTVRMVFETAMMVLACYDTGHRSIEDDQQEAQLQDDGILRE